MGFYICLAYNCKIGVLVAKYLAEMSVVLKHLRHARDDRHQNAMAIVNRAVSREKQILDNAKTMLISAFVVVSWIVQILFFINPK